MSFSLEEQNLISKEFAHLKGAYFNSAYFGPSPIRAQNKVQQALGIELNPSFYPYSEWTSIPERLRNKMANLLKVSCDHIAHSTSSSDTINNVAHGYSFKPGDTVVAFDRDYPSNILPWMVCQKHNTNMKFELIKLENQTVPTAEWLAQKLPKQTKILNLSHVAFDTGRKVDLISLGKLARERNILFIVDVTQSLGGLEITQEELQNIDILTCSTYKWMLGPYGTAFAYYSKKAMDEVHHNSGNWLVSPNSKLAHNLLEYTTETLPGARKFDRGQSPNMLANACLEAGLDFYSELSFKNIEKHNQSLRDHFLNNYPKKKYDLITPREHMGNIVCLKAKNMDSLVLENKLKNSGVDISVREGNLRLSFHLFNSLLQVETLMTALDH